MTDRPNVYEVYLTRTEGRPARLAWVAVSLDAQWVPTEPRPDRDSVVTAHGVWPGKTKAEAIKDACAAAKAPRGRARR